MSGDLERPQIRVVRYTLCQEGFRFPPDADVEGSETASSTTGYQIDQEEARKVRVVYPTRTHGQLPSPHPGAVKPGLQFRQDIQDVYYASQWPLVRHIVATMRHNMPPRHSFSFTLNR